jgi:hypothetical protein
MPIGLTFNRKGKFSTIPGGICSFLTTAVILTFFAVRITMLATESTGSQFDVVFYN